jgi:hypothetical protein
MKYKPSIDENFNNFYFLNGQVIGIGAFTMPRSGNHARAHDRRQNEVLMNHSRDLSLKNLAVILNGKFAISMNPPSEQLDRKFIKRLHHLC